MGARHCLLRIEVEGIEHIVDTVGTETDAHTTDARHTEDASEIVVTTTTRDTAHGGVECLHLEDGTCVVIESTGKSEVELYLVLQTDGLECVENEGCLLHSLESYFTIFEYITYHTELLVIIPRKLDNRLKFGDGRFTDSIVAQLLIDIIQTNLVEFVDGNGDIHDFIGLTNHFGNTGEYLSVVDLDLHINTKTCEYGIDNLHEFNLIEQGVATDNIGITLIELAVATTLWTVGTPYGLYLIALERQLEFVAVHHYIACKRDGKVIAKTLLADTGSKTKRIGILEFVVAHLTEEVTTIEHLEEEFVALFAILAHECLQSLHCRSLNLLKSIKGIHRAYGVEDIVTLCHLLGREVARTFGNIRFLCHSLIFSL